MAAGVNLRENKAPFVAGMAALRLRRWDDAARSYATLVEPSASLGMSPFVAYAYVLLGRAHAGAHHVDEAKKAYEEAFTVWKEADADMPILLDAKKEYAELK